MGQCRFKILIRFAWETNDEVAGKGDIGPGGAKPGDRRGVFSLGMAAVHGGENAVSPALHREMEIGHQRFLFAEGGDEVGVHVAGVRGRKADALDPLNAGEMPAELAKTPDAILARSDRSA